MQARSYAGTVLEFIRDGLDGRHWHGVLWFRSRHQKVQMRMPAHTQTGGHVVNCKLYSPKNAFTTDVCHTV